MHYRITHNDTFETERIAHTLGEAARFVGMSRSYLEQCLYREGVAFTSVHMVEPVTLKKREN